MWSSEIRIKKFYDVMYRAVVDGVAGEDSSQTAAAEDDEAAERAGSSGAGADGLRRFANRVLPQAAPGAENQMIVVEDDLIDKILIPLRELNRELHNIKVPLISLYLSDVDNVQPFLQQINLLLWGVESFILNESSPTSPQRTSNEAPAGGGVPSSGGGSQAAGTPCGDCEDCESKISYEAVLPGQYVRLGHGQCLSRSDVSSMNTHGLLATNPYTREPFSEEQKLDVLALLNGRAVEYSSDRGLAEKLKLIEEQFLDKILKPALELNRNLNILKYYIIDNNIMNEDEPFMQRLNLLHKAVGSFLLNTN